MANAMYDKAREAFLNGDISWRDDTIMAVLVDFAHYTADLTADEFLDDITDGDALVGTPQELLTKTSTAGVADALDITLPTVPAGDPCEAHLIYQDTGLASSSRLIALIDTATGLPVTPNGGDVVTYWDNGANRIFKL